MARTRPADFAAQNAVLLVGKRLAAWRKLQRLPQQVVAERAGVSRGVIVKIENGDSGVSIDSWFRVLGALNLTDEVTAACDPRRSARAAERADELLPQRVRL